MAEVLAASTGSAASINLELIYLESCSLKIGGGFGNELIFAKSSAADAAVKANSNYP